MKLNRKIRIRKCTSKFKFRFRIIQIRTIVLCNIDREESKPDSDLDEPWIMTVKGNNFNNSKQGAAILSGDEAILSTSPYKHNGSSNSLTRDSNLNHYKVNQVSNAVSMWSTLHKLQMYNTVIGH